MKSLSEINDWLNIQEHQKLGAIRGQCDDFDVVSLDMALDAQRFEKMHLGKILMNMNIISPQKLETVLDLQADTDTEVRAN